MRFIWFIGLIDLEGLSGLEGLVVLSEGLDLRYSIELHFKTAVVYEGRPVFCRKNTNFALPKSTFVR